MVSTDHSIILYRLWSLASPLTAGATLPPGQPRGIHLFDQIGLLRRQIVCLRAIKRKTGARGLRSIIEHALLDIMFELPGMKDVSKVVVDEKTVIGEGKPLLIYAEQAKAAG